MHDRQQCTPCTLYHKPRWWRRAQRATVVCEIPRANPTMGSSVYHNGHHNIHCWATGFILSAMPKLSQPSTLHWMVRWVPAVGLCINNKWRWRVWTVAAYRQTHSQGYLTWSVFSQSLMCLRLWSLTGYWHYMNMITDQKQTFVCCHEFGCWAYSWVINPCVIATQH